ncbi:MAG: hypothetical protein ACRCUS_10290, partial [Anaerovoracaceae bacterium]
SSLVSNVNNTKQDDFDNFIKEIESSETEQYIADKSVRTTIIKDERFLGLGEKIDDDTVQLETIRVTTNFFDIFDIESGFNKNNIISKFLQYKGNNEIPVLLGNAYKKRFQKGDIFYDDLKERYKVIGFTSQNEFYVSPFESSKAIYLDNAIIVPIKSKSTDFIEFASTVFINPSKDFISNTINRSEELGLYPLEARSFEGEIEESTESMQNEMLTMLSVVLLMCLFAAIGIISYIIRFIDNKLYEFSIHCICGARQEYIVARVLAQILLMGLVAGIPIFIFYGVSKVTLLTYSVGIIFTLLLAIYPYFIFKKQSINSIKRSNTR